MVFVCSTSAPEYKLVNNPNYPDIVQELPEHVCPAEDLSVRRNAWLSWPVFPSDGKRAALKTNPASNPFVKPQDYRDYLERSEAAFENELKQQQ